MPKSQSAQNQPDVNILDKIVRSMSGSSAEEIAMVKKAFAFVERAHLEHKRLSGEPYLKHLSETAQILTDLGAGGATIAAGLLHDTIEDVGIKREEIVKEFGEEIAFLVEGVTKLGHLKYRGIDRHNESLRKLFVAMSEDIRVLLIKLADRLHNMRTLSYVPKDKQRRIAAETLEIYAPIAYRLGIRKINRELEDLSFPYVYPKAYEEMTKALKERHQDRIESLEKFSHSVIKTLVKEGLTTAKTEYRVKGLYSLYKKYLRYDKDLEKIYDVNAIRIMVDSVADCYQALGAIHGRWRPLPHRIKDYIAFPKPNGYQALHTTVFVGDGNIVEVQIKTHEMYRYSEYGVASHLLYKADKQGKKILDWIYALLPKLRRTGNPSALQEKDVPKWISELASYRGPAKNQRLFRERLASDFFNYRIFVFSPKGDVVDLPIGSTPIDFAYSIHSNIGDHMTGAKVNGKLVALDTELHNGDIVFIMTSETAKPNRKWLDMTKTSMARRHIRRELIKLRESENS
ncbi:MAG: bifunctional (p)ppGpp synthetase/guanosine-3',5'-bis(diphosphate) 3'-pyrophosphohydrolase [Candidatus Zambryskibacteria bacterium]|nr:bifunctional (p)ppGpp synthetase/guanosine-3',5'-bis(diphosphate) 3'-pyrophosphohydrolase [Candidatus Zambryskibacteria bacterium]